MHHNLDIYPIPEKVLYINDVPMDLNADKIMWRLYRIYMVLDDPDYRNETEFSTSVGIIVAQLEIYDQVWVARDAA